MALIQLHTNNFFNIFASTKEMIDDARKKVGIFPVFVEDIKFFATALGMKYDNCTDNGLFFNSPIFKFARIKIAEDFCEHDLGMHRSCYRIKDASMKYYEDKII